jgi:hypothetical protein
LLCAQVKNVDDSFWVRSCFIRNLFNLFLHNKQHY